MKQPQNGNKKFICLKNEGDVKCLWNEIGLVGGDWIVCLTNFAFLGVDLERRTFEMNKVLLLNLSEEVLGVITWMDAVKKMVRGVARKPYGHTEEYEIPTSSGVFKLPTAIVLIEYVNIPYKKAPLTAENLLKRDSGECQYCGKGLSRSSLTMDHIVPVSRGGKKIWKNIVASCKSCNNKKDNKTLSEANMKLRKKPKVPTRTVLLMTISEVKSKKSWSRWFGNVST